MSDSVHLVYLNTMLQMLNRPDLNEPRGITVTRQPHRTTIFQCTIVGNVVLIDGKYSRKKSERTNRKCQNAELPLFQDPSIFMLYFLTYVGPGPNLHV
jgi:hypothetical protein